jgi:hypothetical protein
MAVTFTPNIGLAKPTEAELASNWVDGTQLQDDNNQIIIAAMNIPVNSYTPSLAATTTAPTVGTTGSAKGQYQEIQKMIFGVFLIDFSGTSIGAGSGEYGISLPFPADSSFHVVGTTFNGTPGDNSVIGECYFNDNSAADTSGTGCLDVVTVAGVSYMRILTEAHTSPVKTSRMFRDAMPFTLADQDRFTGSFCYLRA